MDINNVNALFARGAVYNMLGNYQKAIDDYSLALEMDSKRKTVYRNLGKFLGLNNNDYADNDKNISREEPSYYMNSSKTIDNMVLDGDINRYVYNHFKDLALKNVGNNLLQMSIAKNNSSNIDKNNSASDNNNNGSYDNPSNTRSEIKPLSAADYLRSAYMNNNNNINKNNSSSAKSKMFSPISTERNQSAIKTDNSYRESVPTSNMSLYSNNINNNTNLLNNYYMEKDKNKFDRSTVRENSVKSENFVKTNNEVIRTGMNSVIGDDVNTENKKDKKKNLEKWEVFHAQGYAARKKENYSMAIDLYTNALSINPKYFKALFNRGFAYDKIGEYDRAILDYTKSLEVEPNNAYAYYNRAISYDKKGEIEKTLQDFTTAIKLLPTKIDFYLNRAYAFRKIKDYDMAIKDYSEVIKLDNNNNKVNNNK